MSGVITVRSVERRNSFSGRHMVWVSSQATDEFYNSRWSLSSRPTYPEEKLILSSVYVGDEVLVNNLGDPFSLNSGEYIQLIKRLDPSPPKTSCECGAPLWSDGSIVRCNNRYCYVSAAERIGHLCSLTFDPPNMTRDEFTNPGYEIMINNPIAREMLGGKDRINYTFSNTFQEPAFGVLRNPQLWGVDSSARGFKSILSSEKFHYGVSEGTVNLATVLNENLLRSFLDSHYGFISRDMDELKPISMYFSQVEYLKVNRYKDNYSQNHFLVTFLRALSLEHLTPDLATAMVNYDIGTLSDFARDPFYIYALFLTDTSMMVRELGLTPIEANTLYQEVLFRWEELHDIFMYYLEPDGLQSTFGKIAQVRGWR